MTDRKILIIVAFLGAATALIWRSNATVASRPWFEAHHHPGALQTSTALRTSAASAPTPLSARRAKVDLRAQFRESRNYAAFVGGLAVAAASGDPVAQYLTARALKYCNDTANHYKIFRNPGGSLRTRNDVEVRIGRNSLDLQHEILDRYDRCQEYLADDDETDATTAWAGWLDKASAAGYPP